MYSGWGSAITHPSATGPDSRHCNAPLPVHSSSTTDRRCTSAHGATPRLRSPRTAPAIATSPAFMSPAPRPYSQSPSRRGTNGGEDHNSAAAGGTTSTCPLRISDRPPSAAASHVATTLRLAETSHENGEDPGSARSASASSQTSRGARPTSRNACSITTCPASSAPSTVGAATSRSSTSTIHSVSAATAAVISASVIAAARPPPIRGGSPRRSG